MSDPTHLAIAGIAGRPFDEATVVRAALAYEQASEWSARRPAL